MIIYVITNTLNGKQYVGQTIQTLAQRFRAHCWLSSGAGGKRMPIALAMHKYGAEHFRIEVLCTCSSQADLDAMELHYATALNTFVPNGYNLRAGNGRGSVAPEVVEKLRTSNRGKKASEKTRRKLSELHRGKKLSEATRAKLSRYWKGKPLPSTARAKSLAASVKTYELLDPGGRPVTVTNMAAFCREHGLERSQMSEVTRGHKRSHKGWRSAQLIDPLPRRTTPRKASAYKAYTFLDPGGLNTTITNLSRFCDEHDLVYTAMIEVASGGREQYRGWRRGTSASNESS